MSLPEQHQVRFEIPMDTNDESRYGSATSNAAVGNTAFYFGIGAPAVPPLPRFNFGMDIPMSSVASASPTMQQPFNLGLDLPPRSIPAQAEPPAGQVLQPFNLGFDLPPRSTPAQAEPPASQVLQPFNLGFGLLPCSTPAPAEPPAGQVLQPFNLGFGLPPRSTPAQAEPPAGQVLQPFNLGLDLPPRPTPPQRQPPAGPVLQPFNLGFQLTPPSTPPQAELPASPILQPFNLGFNLNIPIKQPQEVVPAVQTGDRHVGYTAANRLNSDPPAAFQFNCGPLPPIGDWEPVPIRAPSLMPADGPSGAMPPAPVAPPARRPQQPTLASLIGNAEQAAIDIVKHLHGDEFDYVATMMVGGRIRATENVRDPMPDEVLDSNRVMISAFCENRDRLTRIFKDMISLHHMAQVQERVAPMVNSLLCEVEIAEELIATSDE
ncbi:hypothetical protein DEU56DRAFT_758548 [Suillus clintonianus]|uniref:uncharacterized protein n=1 Tax=Suillus clintonianus TaxID=1904413 RepID=UPI001B867F79|nr:uncharacterized protein DEU56DRAFT_758548 [Suillus clintonianus]KAG2127663.1 hypothetical protein DEU56DRAFT_758548 [Suillus clintonianus]